MDGTMKIALAASNQRIVSSNNGDTPLMADRTAVGPWEIFDVLTQDEHGNWIPFELPAQPLQPQPPTVSPWNTFVGSAQEWFGQLVYGEPFGQATLLALEPTLNANGWLLTPPNAAGDRTKVSYKPSEWVRVGFGEGFWVWVEQS